MSCNNHMKCLIRFKLFLNINSGLIQFYTLISPIKENKLIECCCFFFFNMNASQIRLNLIELYFAIEKLFWKEKKKQTARVFF